MAAMQNIATTTDDTKNRATTRQRFTVFSQSENERGGGRGTEGALCYGPPKHRVGLTRREATDRDAVDGMKLENCPAYVREWMERAKRSSDRLKSVEEQQ